jgi:hypothetical protein
MRPGTTFSLLLCSGLAGCEPSYVQECVDACQLAATCNVLPSPLGGGDDLDEAKENCSARCSLTSSDIRSSVVACFAASGTEGTSISEMWCSPESTCAKFSACLQKEFPGQEILGKASVTTGIGVDPGAAAGSLEASSDTVISEEVDAGDADPGSSEDSRGMAELLRGTTCCTKSSCASSAQACTDARICVAPLSADAKRRCTAIGASDIVYYAEQDERRIAMQAVSCLEGLASMIAIGGLRPGLVTVGVQLRGVLSTSVGTSEDAGAKVPDAMVDVDRAGAQDADEGRAAIDATSPPSPPLRYCLVFKAGAQVIQAGFSSHRILVPVPIVTQGMIRAGGIVTRCENDIETCINGRDDDGDGATDCADLECRDVCSQLCRGLGAGADAAVDCRDPRCATSAVCRPEDATTGSADSMGSMGIDGSTDAALDLSVEMNDVSIDDGSHSVADLSTPDDGAQDSSDMPPSRDDE